MRKYIIFLTALLLAVGLLFSSCMTDPNTGVNPGKLTITNIPANYLEKYIAGTGVVDVSALNTLAFTAQAPNVLSITTLRGAKISGTSVILNVYQRSTISHVPYTGSDTVSTLTFFTGDAVDINVIGENNKGVYSYQVNFVNGLATIDFSQIIGLKP